MITLTSQDPGNPPVRLNPEHISSIRPRKRFSPNLASQQGGVDMHYQGAMVSLVNQETFNVTESVEQVEAMRSRALKATSPTSPPSLASSPARPETPTTTTVEPVTAKVKAPEAKAEEKVQKDAEVKA